MRRTPTTPRKEHRPLRRRTRALESSLPPKSHGGAAGKRRKAAPISSALVWWARAHASMASMASTAGRPRRHPAALAEPARTRRARPLAPSRRWRRRRLAAAGGDSSARRHELWPSPKGQLTAGIGQLPSACGRLAAPRLGGSDRAWRARQPCTRRGRRLRTARVALAWSCRCTLWRRWCNAAGQWARRAAGAPLATRCASCSGAVDAAGGGEATAGGLAWPPFASGPGTSADLAGCSLDQQRVGSACERTVAWCACGRAGGAFGPRRRAHGSEATARSGHRMRSGRPAAPGAARCSEKAPAARPRPRALQK